MSSMLLRARHTEKRPRRAAAAILHAKHFAKAPRSWRGNNSSNDSAAPAPPQTHCHKTDGQKEKWIYANEVEQNTRLAFNHPNVRCYCATKGAFQVKAWVKILMYGRLDCLQAETSMRCWRADPSRAELTEIRWHLQPGMTIIVSLVTM